MSSIPNTKAAREIVSGLSGFDWATEAGVCTVGPMALGAHAMGVEEGRDLCRCLHLSRGHEGELVEQALGVLHRPDDAARRAVLVPQVSDLQVKRRGDAARHGDLIRSGRIVPGEQREHRLAEGAVAGSVHAVGRC